MAVIAAFSLVLMLPATASAYNTNLHKYGIGTRGGDFRFTTAAEELFAAGNDQHIRGLIDCGAGDPRTVYASKFSSLASNGITILPIIGWKDSGGAWHDIDTAGERSTFATCAQNAVTAVQTAWGFGTPNVYEVWNEPNCVVTGQECTFSGFTSVGDYWDNAYGPAAFGIRTANSSANVIVGGLGFGCYPAQSGCTSPNGFNDAGNWILAFHNNGWDVGDNVNGYSIHPYGYTNSMAPFNREATANQTAAKAHEEYIRALVVADSDILATEFGRRTDTFTQSQQVGYLDAMDDGTLGVNNAKLLSNWTGQDASTSGVFTSGLYDVNGVGKLAQTFWDNHNTGTLVGSLSN